MENMQLIPTGSMGGDALAAGAGAFIGSWFGNGFGGNGFGRNGADAAVVAATTGAEAIMLDQVGNLQTSINGLGLNLVQGQGQASLTACQGFGGVNQTIMGSAADTKNVLVQGFAGLNTVIQNGDSNTRFAILEAARSAAECCCETQRTIVAEGAATRQLIQQNLITEMQVQLCDSKARVAQLENQVYLGASQAAQTQQIIQTVLAHLPLTVK